jgi:hypothetical protein
MIRMFNDSSLPIPATQQVLHKALLAIGFSSEGTGVILSFKSELCAIHRVGNDF